MAGPRLTVISSNQPNETNNKTRETVSPYFISSHFEFYFARRAGRRVKQEQQLLNGSCPIGRPLKRSGVDGIDNN